MSNSEKVDYKTIAIPVGDLTIHVVADPEEKLKKENIVGISRQGKSENNYKDVYLDVRDARELLRDRGISLDSFYNQRVSEVMEEIPQKYVENLANKGEVNLVEAQLRSKYSAPSIWNDNYREYQYRRPSIFSKGEWVSKIGLQAERKAYEKVKSLTEKVANARGYSLELKEVGMRANQEEYKKAGEKCVELLSGFILKDSTVIPILRKEMQSLGISPNIEGAIKSSLTSTFVEKERVSEGAISPDNKILKEFFTDVEIHNMRANARQDNVGPLSKWNSEFE
jgi:hypothetical protein